MENVLISACLLGFECKYCGGSNKLPEQQLAALRERFRLIPVTPASAWVKRLSAIRAGM